MNEMKKVLIAMSGGVDSSAAALLLKEQAYNCIGVTMKLFDYPDYNNGKSALRTKSCCSLTDVTDAALVANRLGMPHYVLNYKDEFKKNVIERFIKTYERGATPNPCIDCNKYLKFNSLLLRGKQLEYDYFSTGHYAQITKSSGGRYLLQKAVDKNKDQSYVLYNLTQEQLASTIFPLGALTKKEVRQIAIEGGLVNAKKEESQDICFVPDGDYGAFMECYTGKTYPAGDIIDTRGNIIGRHKGQARYTIGQRRGLGVAKNIPLYVCAKDAVANTVTLGTEDSLYAKSFIVNEINLIPCEKLDSAINAKVKTRYLS
jgi:tRNA-specific 2-thiouridylase